MTRNTSRKKNKGDGEIRGVFVQNRIKYFVCAWLNQVDISANQLHSNVKMIDWNDNQVTWEWINSSLFYISGERKEYKVNSWR
jgi:hypothetical protein